MGENGDSVLKVVQLFIDNINESAKNTTKELDKVSVKLEDVKTKINTPPRHEELSVQMSDVKDKISEVNNNLIDMNGRIKTMINTVRVAAAVLAAAVLLSGGIIHYGKKMENKSIERIEHKIDNHLTYNKEEVHEDGGNITRPEGYN